MKYVFSNRIIAWYQANKRELPWRQTKDPYKIWLSEIILQQTRVSQGLPYYNRFEIAYPTIQDLAEAKEQDVLKLWQGLGYYSRARNLHATAQHVTHKLDGVFPTSYKDLLHLKGVGDYTASAIASFCYNEITPTVDGNVYRVLARYFGIETPINESRAKGIFKELAGKLIDPIKPALFNQAIMEFGALQCTPKSPNCIDCIFSDSCVALQKHKVNILPVKTKKVKVKNRYFNYIVLQTADNKTVLNKRTGKGIWQNLYEFPLIETKSVIDFDDLLQEKTFVKMTEEQKYELKLLNPKSIIHKLSHQHLHIKFWSLELMKWKNATLTKNEAKSLPVPIVIHNFMIAFW